MKRMLANIANAIIANFRLRRTCDYRIVSRMDMVPPEIACRVLDGLEGTTAVAKLLKLPTSTVHSWRRIGMTASRADHVRLAASASGRTVDFETGSVCSEHGEKNYSPAPDEAPGKIGQFSPSTAALAGGVN